MQVSDIEIFPIIHRPEYPIAPRARLVAAALGGGRHRRRGEVSALQSISGEQRRSLRRIRLASGAVRLGALAVLPSSTLPHCGASEAID